MSDAGKLVRYVIQPGLGRITVQAFASGLLSALGHSPTFAAIDYSGEATFDPETGAGSARLEIRSASLELLDQMSASDRRQILETMQRKVLETDRFGTIVYLAAGMQVATEASRFVFTVDGELSLHGVTQKLPLTVRAMKLGDSLRASGEVPLSLKDFSISPPSVAGSMLKIKDELKVSFDLVAKEHT